MSWNIVARTRARGTYMELADSLGRTILFSATAVHALVDAGETTLKLEIPLPIKPSDTNYITIADAARLHEGDVDNMPFEKARTRIRRAIADGSIATTQFGKKLRINFHSFSTWRLQAREHNLDNLDVL